MVVAELSKSRIDHWPIAPAVEEMECSVIREILKISSQPGVISFAGGLPAPELFPLAGIQQALIDALAKYGPACVQYALSMGIPPLLDLIAERSTAAGQPTKRDNILITAGSQQGLDLIGRLFVSPGDYVMTENPTYVGALQAFNYYRARYAPVSMDADGIVIDEAEKKIKKFKPRFIYTISNFHNPTGITMSMARREALVELAAKYGVPIVEDNPYGEVRFAGERLPDLKSLAPNLVISLGTFSKVCAPGLRIAWMNGPTEIMQALEKVKQGTDLHTNTLCQYIILEFVKAGRLEPHIEVIKKDYRAKRDVMLRHMRAHFPGGIKWTEPEGGMFLWVTLPPHVSAKDLLPKAIEMKVAYVYGEPFFPVDGQGLNTMRLNYSNATQDGIKTGIERLAKLFAENM